MDAKITPEMAKEILIKHGIERGIDDSRSVVEIATLFLKTGSTVVSAAQAESTRNR